VVALPLFCPLSAASVVAFHTGIVEVRRIAALVPASGSSKESEFPGYHLAPIFLCRGKAL
jgi:hypothetical protein